MFAKSCSNKILSNIIIKQKFLEISLKNANKLFNTKRYISSTSSFSSSFASLLQDNHKTIINDEREMLTELYSTLQSIGVTQDELDLVADTRSRIDDLFMVVICGEFNAGKSTFINSILGAKHCKEGILPTTAKICIIRSATNSTGNDLINDPIWKKAENIKMDDVEELAIHLDWLNYISIIDTPGTNAIITRHEQLTTQIVHRADLVLFVTSAERPISESETIFLKKIRQWGKKIIMIVNKMDILQDEKERNVILDYVTQNSAQILQSSKQIPVFGVSARQALNAKLVIPGGDPATGSGASRWHESNIGDVEEYLKSVLGQDDLIKQKLENPLVVSDRLLTDAVKLLEQRSIIIESDLRILEMIDENMVIFMKDMDRDLRYFKQHIETITQQMIGRSDTFLEENISIFNPSLLLDSKSFQNQFNKDVIIDIETPINQIIEELSTLISQRARVQARSVIEYIGNRPKKYSDSMIGNVQQDSEFDNIRHQLVEKLMKDSHAVIYNHNQEKNVLKISEGAKNALLSSAAIGSISAATATGLASVHLLDITGIMTLSSIAVMGLMVVPWKKTSIRKDFELRITSFQTQLTTTFVNNLERELTLVNEKIMTSISPYSRFVKIEQNKIHNTNIQLESLRKKVRDLQYKINNK